MTMLLTALFKNRSFARAWRAIFSIWIMTALSAAEHPRLLFGIEDLPALRARQRQEPYASMLAQIQSVSKRDGNAWQESDAAVNCAFVYVITGDDAWAAKSRAYVEKRFAATNQPWDSHIKGLDLYMHGKSVALAYDMCFEAPSWKDFRATVAERLRRQADRIFTNGGTDQNTDPGSNWQAIRWSTAALCYLALDEPAPAGAIDASFARMRAWVIANMGDKPGNRGWNSEGRGYTSYPWGHIGPWAIAAQRLAGQDLRSVAPDAVDHALWTVYAGACRIPSDRPGQFAFHADFGDDNPNGGSIAEGSYGLAFRFCPPQYHPGLVFWYDRMKGGAGDRSWDSSRAGAIYSYLFHPGASVKPADPLSIPTWREACLDTSGNGMFLFRNRYRDGDDLCAQFFAKLRGNHGHNGPDALGFRIVGHGTAWATGGGRYGTKIDGVEAYWRSQNSLYPVDPSSGPLSSNGNSGSIVGTPTIATDGSGSVVASIATSNLGVRDHTRRFLADYSTASGADGVWVISDTSANGVFWQLCTLEPNTITIDTNTFLITAPSGATLKGTVLYPNDPHLTSGTRARGNPAGWNGASYTKNQFVHCQSAEGDYLIVLTAVMPGRKHPAVTSTSGSNSASDRLISIGKLHVRIGDGQIETVTGNKLGKP